MEELLIIVIVLQVLIIIGVVILTVKNKKHTEVSVFDDSKLKEEIRHAINTNVLELSSHLTKTLLDSSTSSSKSIADFRVNVNKELEAFKEVLNVKLQQEFKMLSDNVEKKMSGINDKVEERLNKGFETTNSTFLSIKERMAVMETTQQKIEGLSNEMLGLQNILTNNQQRGAFGEYQLEQILYSTFGDNNSLYQIQYEFKSPQEKEKVRADSVIFMPNGIVCIDSKFPYSSYYKLFEERLSDNEEANAIKSLKNDVKKHIDAIANKYIIEGITTDFAVMFLPSDGVLALLHLKVPEIIEYANNRKVIIVSPTTIIPLIASYRIVKIDYERSKYAKELTEQLLALGKDFERFAGRWTKLTDDINKLSRASDDVDKSVTKITNKFNKLKASEAIESTSEVE